METQSQDNTFLFACKFLYLSPIISKIVEKLIPRRLYKFANDEKKICINLNLVLERVLVQQMLYYCSHMIFRHQLTGMLNQGNFTWFQFFWFSKSSGTVFKLRIMGFGGPLFNGFKESLTNQKCVTIVDKFSQFMPIVSGVLHLMLYIKIT